MCYFWIGFTVGLVVGYFGFLLRVTLKTVKTTDEKFHDFILGLKATRKKYKNHLNKVKTEKE